MIPARLLDAARHRGVWLGLLGLALAIRLALVLTAPHRLLWGDGILYERIAAELELSGRYSQIPIYPPGYPFFIAGVYAVFGRDLLALRVIEAFLSAGTVGLVGWFGVRLFGPVAGLLAALLAALHPVMAFLPVTQYPENLLLFLSTLAFGVFALALRQPSGARWLGAGLLFGLTMLVKPVATALLPGFAIGSWLRMGAVRYSRLRAAALFALGMAIVLTPWTLRNHAVHDRWFLVSVGGGRIFWMVNNPGSDGVSVMPDSPSLSDTLWATPSLVDRDGYYYREGQRFVREDPARALGHYLIRMGRLWALYPTPVTKNQYSVRVADWAQALASIVIYLGALLGMLRLRGTGLIAFPLGILTFTLVNSWYFMVLRYRLTFEVLLLWLAGWGYAAWLEGRGRSTPPPAATPVPSP